MCQHSRGRPRLSYLSEVIDAEDKTNGIEDIALSGTIETGDGIEFGIPTSDDRTGGVTLKTLENYLLDVHSHFQVEIPPIRCPWCEC